MVFHWSLRLLSVFWSILAMLLFGWSWLILLFPALPAPYQVIGDRSKRTSYNWYRCHLHIAFFSSLARSEYLTLFYFEDFRYLACLHHFLLIIPRSGFLAEIRWCLYLKIPVNFMYLIIQDGFWFVYLPFCSGQIKIFCTIPCGSLCPPNHVEFNTLFALI